MATIKVLLYTSKVLKNGEHPIMIRLTKDRKLKYISVGHSCHADLWDTKKDLPKRKHPNFRELEINIEKKRTEAKGMLIALENEKSEFSIEELKSKVLNNSKKLSVFSYLDEVIEDLIKTGRIGYAASHKDLRRVLKKFRDEKDFSFSDIDTVFLHKLEQSFSEQGFKGNTKGIYFRTLRALFNKAVKDNYAKQTSNPFKEYSISHLKNDTRKRAITKVEIDRIKALVVEKGTRLYHSKNFFLFSYYCFGINFIDVAKLQWTNIINIADKTFIDYTRSKTKKNFRFQLVAPAVDILNYYKEFRVNNYIFPYLDNHKHTEALSIDNRYKKTKRQVNEDLKELATLAGIETNLTTYVARHTFATVMKRSGVSTSMISDMMGHGSETETQTYLDGFENEQVYDAAQLLI